MCAAGDCHIIHRCQRFLFRINHFQFLDSALFQLPPHNLRERADGSLVNVSYLKSSRIQLISSSHRADDRRVACFRLLYQHQFSRHGIDRVDHVIILGKIKLICSVRRVERLVGVDNRMRVDGFDAFLGNIDFILSDGGGGRNDLAVDVG